MQILSHIGKTCLSRTILETERRFFGEIEDVTFSEGGQEADASLSDRETSVLLLDKRNFCIRSVFRSIEDRSDVQSVLKEFHTKNHAQYEAHDRKLSILSQQQQ